MRTWDLGDPEPSDHPPIVDDDSITWVWTEVEEDVWLWVQQGVSLTGNFGQGWKELPWSDLLTEFGPVRELSPEEAEALDL